jgi:hypothetical protein
MSRLNTAFPPFIWDASSCMWYHSDGWILQPAGSVHGVLMPELLRAIHMGYLT